MKTIAAFFTMLTIPVTLMNVFGGIVSGIWLAWIGEWKIIGVGLITAIFGTFPLSIALMPALFFALPASKSFERGRFGLGVLYSLPGTIYTEAVMICWCALVFSIASGVAIEGHETPILLWSYGAAVAPWTRMASKDGSNPASAISASFMSIAYILITAMRLLGNAGFATCVIALISVMSIEFTLQVAMTISAMRSPSRNT